jgi:hypothetical protein
VCGDGRENFWKKARVHFSKKRHVMGGAINYCPTYWNAYRANLIKAGVAIPLPRVKGYQKGASVTR